MRQIALDTETTGLETKDGHRIIEIGCIEIVNRRITDNRFHCYINPEREIDAGALEVHGISQEFLVDKPVFAEVVPELINYIDGAELIIHNAPFDIGFLNYELNLLSSDMGHISRYCTVLDTLVMARDRHPGQRNSLDALCKRYQVDNSQRDLHGALIDAVLLAQVYLAMTGGQSTFLETLDETLVDKATTSHQTTKQKSLQGDYKVLFANDKELVAHQSRLDAIGETAFWFELEAE